MWNFGGLEYFDLRPGMEGLEGVDGVPEDLKEGDEERGEGVVVVVEAMLSTD